MNRIFSMLPEAINLLSSSFGRLEFAGLSDLQRGLVALE